MARASYLIKKDGRFWLQKRFAVKPGIAERKPTHLRICLRTGEYRSAVDRMLRLMFEIQAYESCPDLFSEERLLLTELKQYVDAGIPRSFDELLIRRPTEAFGQRYLQTARARSHPTSEDFWPLWKTFIDQTWDGEIRAQTSVEEAYENGRKAEREAREKSSNLKPRLTPEPRTLPPVSARSDAPIRLLQSVPVIEASVPAFRGLSGPQPVVGAPIMLSAVRARYLADLEIKNGDRRADEDAGLAI